MNKLEGQGKKYNLRRIESHRGRGMAMNAQEYEIGNSKVIVHDDYIVKTDEERQEILDRIGTIYSDSCITDT